MVERIIKLRVLQKIYQNNTEILGIFKTRPLSIAKTLIARIDVKVSRKRIYLNQLCDSLRKFLSMSCLYSIYYMLYT